MSNATDSRLLAVHLKMKNIGKVPVKPEHLMVTVRDIPDSLKPGVLEISKLKELYAEDVRKRYPDGYLLEPGGEV